MIKDYIEIRIRIINKNIDNELKEFRKADILNAGLNFNLENIVNWYIWIIRR